MRTSKGLPLAALAALFVGCTDVEPAKMKPPAAAPPADASWVISFKGAADPEHAKLIDGKLDPKATFDHEARMTKGSLTVCARAFKKCVELVSAERAAKIHDLVTKTDWNAIPKTKLQVSASTLDKPDAGAATSAKAVASSAPDAGVSDAGVSDAGVGNAGVGDAGAADAGTDAGRARWTPPGRVIRGVDAGSPDAGATPAATPSDAGVEPVDDSAGPPMEVHLERASGNLDFTVHGASNIPPVKALLDALQEISLVPPPG